MTVKRWFPRPFSGGDDCRRLLDEWHFRGLESPQDAGTIRWNYTSWFSSFFVMFFVFEEVVRWIADVFFFFRICGLEWKVFFATKRWMDKKGWEVGSKHEKEMSD